MEYIVVIDGTCRFCQLMSRLLVHMISVPLRFVDENAPELHHFHDQAVWGMNSIKVIQSGSLFVKSSGIRLLMRRAKWMYQPIRILFLLPKTWLDACYDFVARNRYFFGKSNQCAS